MQGPDLVLAVLGPLSTFIGFLAVGLLGLALLHMIGKGNV